jgi:hypothetical protein
MGRATPSTGSAAVALWCLVPHCFRRHFGQRPLSLNRAVGATGQDSWGLTLRRECLEPRGIAGKDVAIGNTSMLTLLRNSCSLSCPIGLAVV